MGLQAVAANGEREESLKNPSAPWQMATHHILLSFALYGALERERLSLFVCICNGSD